MHSTNTKEAGTTKSSGAGGATIRCRGVHKAYLPHGREPLVALQDIDLDIADGEFVSLVGPSGCGKSTLLNIMAGIDQASAGRIEIFAQTQKDSRRDDGGAPAMRRGYVFQSDTVLPWLTVERNVELGLLSTMPSSQERKRRVRGWLAAVGLEGFEDAHPGQLSGGMRKRVALATAFAHDPAVFFMDEPFAAVDAQTRLRLQAQLLELWAEHKRTVVFVTHDIEEAILLSDRLIVMSPRPGRVLVEHKVTLPRPRRIEDVRFRPQFMELSAQVWTELKDDVDGGGREVKSE